MATYFSWLPVVKIKGNHTINLNNGENFQLLVSNESIKVQFPEFTTKETITHTIIEFNVIPGVHVFNEPLSKIKYPLDLMWTISIDIFEELGKNLGFSTIIFKEKPKTLIEPILSCQKLSIENRQFIFKEHHHYES